MGARFQALGTLKKNNLMLGKGITVYKTYKKTLSKLQNSGLYFGIFLTSFTILKLKLSSL